MTHTPRHPFLPTFLGALRQRGASGALILEQNDGCRRLYLENGELIHLNSDVAGEQFGNYLLRQGILDFPALNELLANEEGFRLGEKVVQWGLISPEECNCHLLSLQEQVMIHALEHPILESTWEEGLSGLPQQDLRFKLDHRHFVWMTFQEVQSFGPLSDLLYAEPAWRWRAPDNLLDTLSDLPLNPAIAYALSFLGAEPMGYETFMSLGGLDENESARLIVTLWALGGLTLAQGELPQIQETPSPAPGPVPSAAEPPPPPAPVVPPPAAPAPPPLELAIPLERPAVAAPLTPSEENSAESSLVKARRLFKKAKSLQLQEKTIEAIRALEQSVQLDPDSEAAYEPWLALGKLRLANPAWSTRAIEALQTASRLRPKAAEPWAHMGELYHRKAFKANALACFKKALELDPSVPVPPDLDLKDEDLDPEATSLLGRFKAMLSRPGNS